MERLPQIHFCGSLLLYYGIFCIFAKDNAGVCNKNLFSYCQVQLILRKLKQ